MQIQAILCLLIQVAIVSLSHILTIRDIPYLTTLTFIANQRGLNLIIASEKCVHVIV